MRAFMLLALAAEALAAAGPSPHARAPALAAQHDTCCTLCGGITDRRTYPVSDGAAFYATMTVPGLPLNGSAWAVATYFIYFNIFFDNGVPAGRGVYNQVSLSLTTSL
jgi:hypothetical protein